MRAAWLVMGVVSCAPAAAPQTAPDVAPAATVEADAPSSTTSSTTNEAVEGLEPTKQLLVVTELLRMSDCGHDDAVGELHCAFSVAGEERPVTFDNHLRVFPTEPPGLVLAAIDFEPRAVVESGLAVADCEIEPRGTLRDIRVGAVKGVSGYAIAGAIDVVTATQCSFEERELPRLAAAHLVVMHDKSPRSPKPRSRDEALAIATRAAQEQLPFHELVARYSDEPGAAQRGGDLGTFGVEVMVPEFVLVVLGTPVGGRSPVFESSFGFHIVTRHE